MDSLSQKKIAESNEHVQLAEKSLKKTFFKRNIDYDTASSEYNKAAVCCKVAKQFDKAIEYYQKSADCYISLDSLYNAAKQYEQIAFIANELKKSDLLFDSVNKAVEHFITNGTRDAAGALLEKGAGMIRLNDPEKAIKLYKRSIDIAEVEDKHHEMFKLYEHCISLALRLKNYNEAIEFIKKEMEVLDLISGGSEQFNKYLVSLVIVHLFKEDWVSATNTVNQYVNPESAGKSFVEKLINAYDEKDNDFFKDACKGYLSYGVDNEILKMVIEIPKQQNWDISSAPKAKAAPQLSFQPRHEEPSAFESKSKKIQLPPDNTAQSISEDTDLQDENQNVKAPSSKPHEEDEFEDLC